MKVHVFYRRHYHNPHVEEVVMGEELHKFALRLKVIEILNRYSKVQQQLRIMHQWKKIWVHPN